MNSLSTPPAPVNEFIPTRQTLLSRLRNWGDQESWNDFFETYWRLIYKTALKAGLNNEEAEDVVQETVISVCKAIPEFRYDPNAGSFKGWLLQLTRWRIRDQLRKRLPQEVIRANEKGTSLWPELEAYLPDPKGLALEAVWEQEWDNNLLSAALEKVKTRANPKEYQIFDLSVLQKLPTAKVRTLLNVSSGRVHLAKHRVSGLLKKEMERLEKTCF